MKKTILWIFAMLITSAAFAQQAPPASESDVVPRKPLDTLSARVSYINGMQMAATLKRMPIATDMIAFIMGVQDTLEGREPMMTEEQAKAAYEEFSAQAKADREAQAKKNEEAEQIFLAKNRLKKGVKTTKSGLQYEILKNVAGTKPTIEDTVSVHLKGILIDGTVFDKSFKGDVPTPEDQPIAFPLRKLRAGWPVEGQVEALMMMTPGSKYRVVIPSALGFGTVGFRPPIGPNATLIFELELVSFEKTPPPEPEGDGAEGNIRIPTRPQSTVGPDPVPEGQK